MRRLTDFILAFGAGAAIVAALTFATPAHADEAIAQAGPKVTVHLTHDKCTTDKRYFNAYLVREGTRSADFCYTLDDSGHFVVLMIGSRVFLAPVQAFHVERAM